MRFGYAYVDVPAPRSTAPAIPAPSPLAVGRGAPAAAGVVLLATLLALLAATLALLAAAPASWDTHTRATLASGGSPPVPAADAPVPWPRGQAPTPVELDRMVSDALELFERERAEEFLEAYETGEDSEHVFVLQERIDRGLYDVDALFQLGDGAFEHEFRAIDGYGARPIEKLRRIHDGAYGGLDNFSCAGCHAQGGVNGAGGPTATSFYFGDGRHASSALLRNPPAVLGLGYVQALAAEMTVELQHQRAQAVLGAAKSAKAVTVTLMAKGVEFGSLTVEPDGSVDDSALAGVDPDLVVKPFGWKGHTAKLRRFAERAARIHFGIQSHVLALEHQEDPDPGLYGWGGNWWDPDGDGVSRELEEGTLTALAVYMALLEVPVILPPYDAGLHARWARGSELFGRLGCVDCHRRSLPLASTTVRELPDTTPGSGVEIELGKNGEPPRASAEGVLLFSDLKRHDMGDELADPVISPDGIERYLFITRPLWGLAETGPYLHDGRAATIPEAILAHGGEAAPQRSGFEALSEEQQADLHIYLLSLSREPKLSVPR